MLDLDHRPLSQERYPTDAVPCGVVAILLYTDAFPLTHLGTAAQLTPDTSRDIPRPGGYGDKVLQHMLVNA